MAQNSKSLEFLALDLLRYGKESIVHDSHHDLESFYWLLVWIVLRHTSYNSPYGRREECSRLFKPVNSREAKIAKGGWLYNAEPLIINQNPPLTDLLKTLQDLVYMAAIPTRSKSMTREILTYRGIIDVFESAINREDWPLGDPALPLTPPRNDMPIIIEGDVFFKRAERALDSSVEEDQYPLKRASSESSTPAMTSAKRRRTVVTPSTSESNALLEDLWSRCIDIMIVPKRGREV
ncbi:uncharacterized protein TRAVEDRAFT_49075 [Trametes versicolor FP-101664 SS1]|uniref:uncharacterized protein n=1 Tax=Trametes versicolor (strain FP-101664) TaxID=717944 RepID=UPI0004623785|nr:uncharacterized protein TRAVEDRAFT_49075 [Trametes versicolor FP-101664 SS1]EIW58064.1 hypothetical protein TRAVEDRAFT_49075 [Trametes versicolor FP-101664 SS1]